MQAMSERKMAWRRAHKRGVSPIIATILLVAITVVLAAVLYILISGLTKGPGNTPLGTSLALNKPVEAQKGAGATTNNWYNFSVESAGGGIVLNNINFQVVTSTGGIVTPAAAWTLNVLNLGGTVIGTYSLTTAAWTLGGTTPIVSSQTIVLNAIGATGLSGQGDAMNVIGTGTFAGSIQVSIP
jgi:flagellin-like protein